MIGGAQTLTTHVGGALRSWLILTTTLSRQPLILSLGDVAFSGPDERGAAHDMADERSRDLHRRLGELDEDQLRAFVQQESGDLAGDLLDRVLRYWPRPRLDGVDWLRCGKGRASYEVPKYIQDEDLELEVGTAVMLAGDGFPDVHGTVEANSDSSWTVLLHWNDWDR